MTQRIQIQTVLPQAEAIRDALDLYSRLAMGQFSELAAMISSGAIRVRDDRVPDGHRVADAQEVDEIASKLREITILLGHRRGSSFGIGSPALNDAARSAYEVQKVIDKAIADERNPGAKTVRHDGLLVRYTGHPAPTATLDRAASN